MDSILATAHDYGLGWLKPDKALVDHFSKRVIKKHQVDMGMRGRLLSCGQCSQPSGGPAGPRGETAKSPGRGGRAGCSPSRPP